MVDSGTVSTQAVMARSRVERRCTRASTVMTGDALFRGCGLPVDRAHAFIELGGCSQLPFPDDCPDDSSATNTCRDDNEYSQRGPRDLGCSRRSGTGLTTCGGFGRLRGDGHLSASRRAYYRRSGDAGYRRKGSSRQG